MNYVPDFSGGEPAVSDSRPDGMGQSPDRYSSAPYLMGSMLQDGVDIDLALKVATGYAEVRPNLDDAQTQKWLLAMLHRLPVGCETTALAVLASPSDHDAPHYEQIARDCGWKE